MFIVNTLVPSSVRKTWPFQIEQAVIVQGKSAIPYYTWCDDDTVVPE